MNKPCRPSELPEGRTSPVVIRLSRQRTFGDERVVVERQPPVGIDEQWRAPFEVCFVKPEVVV
jgi:hypothetical protein